MQGKATGAEPIFIGDLVQMHVATTFPTGCVLVADISYSRHEGLDRTILEAAFGAEGVKDVCSDITNKCVITFPEGTTPADVKKALIDGSKKAHLEEEGYKGMYLDQDEIDNLCTIYHNGKPLEWKKVTIPRKKKKAV